MLVEWQKQPYVLTGPPLVWWRKGERFGDLAEIVRAPAVQLVTRQPEVPSLIKPVQMRLL